MPILLRKSHNVTTLLYHLVFPVKYRRKVFTTSRIKEWLINACNDISEKYDIRFESIWIDWDHVHFLVQSAPTLSITNIVTVIKSLTAKRLLKYKTELRWKLRWWEFWTDGYFANTVWASAWFQVIQSYIMNQWYWEKWYKVYEDWNSFVKQPSLF